MKDYPEDAPIPPWCEDCDICLCEAGGPCAVDLFKTAALRLSAWQYEQGYMLDAFEQMRGDRGDVEAEKCFRMTVADAERLRNALREYGAQFPIFSIMSRELDNVGNVLITGRRKNSFIISWELNSFLMSLLGRSDERQKDRINRSDCRRIRLCRANYLRR